jgi:hypothetical protein
VDIEQLWREMEREPGSPMGGWVQRRLLPQSGLEVFLTLDRPGVRRTLRFSVPASLLGDDTELKNSKGVEATIINEDADRRRSILLSLQDQKYTAVFTSLCTDLIDVLHTYKNDEPAALGAFFDRLDRWQQFLERVGTQALSPEAQLGLYAELTFLLQDILPGSPSFATLAWWTGPENAHQDFQLPDAAIEVKATRQISPARIVISSERQLDGTGITRLLLVHSTWDVRRGGTATLPARIEEIRTKLRDSAWLQVFENRLLSAGYSDMHWNHYSDITYTLRKEMIFDVRLGFPRLIESSLPAGVSSVGYSIDLASCRPFEVGRSVLERVISEASYGKT